MHATIPEGSRIAVIGAGISGIAAAHVLRTQGFAPVVFERGDAPGGVWAVAYPGVRLQNVAAQYHLSDVPWPTPPDLHPTGAQIRDYLRHAIERCALDVRLRHEVVALEPVPNGGWLLRYRAPDGEGAEPFAYAVIAVGQYTEGKRRLCLPGAESFAGDVLTERDVTSLDVFDGRRVAVVGFGKSAVDMATLAAPRARSVHQIFRTPRWLLPEHLLGIHFTWALFSRFGTVMMPSWGHPTAAERALHGPLGGVVARFWRMIEGVFRRQALAHAPRGDVAARTAARARLDAVLPAHPLARDLRSASAMAPPDYFRHVADGRIQPVRGEVASLAADGVRLTDGEMVPADLVLQCVGSTPPRFPFLPAEARALLESEPDGVQLYRHLVHPRLPTLGFAGFNHGFLHVPAVEVGTLWLCAVLRGELALPPVDEMERSVERVRAWKRAHVHFEPSRSCATSTRFQQYLDLLLLDLGVSPYRKPHPVAELFGRYGAADYRGVGDEYRRRRVVGMRRPVAVDT